MNKFLLFLILVIVSVIAVFLMNDIHYVLHWLADIHQFLLNKLALLFNGGEWGKILRLTLALVIEPLFLALIPAFFYWLIYRTMMPQYWAVVWVLWFVLLTILSYR